MRDANQDTASPSLQHWIPTLRQQSVRHAVSLQKEAKAMREAPLKTMWRHICMQGVWTYLSLGVDRCPICGKTQKKVSDVRKEAEDEPDD